jgi:hypothetical protein
LLSNRFIINKQIALDSLDLGAIMPRILLKKCLIFRRAACGKELPQWQTPQVIPVCGARSQLNQQKTSS